MKWLSLAASVVIAGLVALAIAVVLPFTFLYECGRQAWLAVTDKEPQ